MRIESAFFLDIETPFIDIKGGIVDSLPFAMILEKGPSCIVQVLLGSMIKSRLLFLYDFR